MQMRMRLRIGLAAMVVAVALGTGATGMAAAGAAAAADPDLSSIVLGEVAGYALAPAGVGLSGPLTDQQITGLAPETATAAQLRETVKASFSRTFENPAGRRVAIVGFDLGSVGDAKDFLAGARESAPELGVVTPVAGVDHAFLVAVSADKLTSASAEEVFLQSGRLVFVVILSDKPTAPVTVAEATDVARAQAAAVPEAIADEKAGEGAAHAIGYAVGLMLPVALIVTAVVVVGRRRKR